MSLKIAISSKDRSLNGLRWKNRSHSVVLFEKNKPPMAKMTPPEKPRKNEM